VTSFVELIIHEFKKVLSQNEWMDKKTKDTALDKVQSLLYKVGYPPFVTNVLQLDDYYAQVERQLFVLVFPFTNYSLIVASVDDLCGSFHYVFLVCMQCQRVVEC
jgi:predicted metalloendopeptidase